MAVKVLLTCVEFLLIPLGFGRCFTYRYKVIQRQDLLSQYMIGAFILFALFTVCCVPITIFGFPFHLLQIVNGILCAVSTILLLMDLWLLHGIRDFRAWIYRLYTFFKTYWYFIIPVVFILLQILRTVSSQTCVYSDDQAYFPMINDMIHSDTIFELSKETGEYIKGLRMTLPKYLFCSWLQFQAVLTSMSGVHPLIIIKHVFPVFMISFHYIIMWKLTFFLSTDYKKRVCMLILYILLMEFGSPSRNTDFSYYLFTWSWYGKTAYQFVVIPMLFLFFFLIDDVITGWREGLLLLFISIAGMGVSSMALILLSIELGMLILISSVRKHTVRETWLCLPAFLPVIVGLLLNYIYF